MPIISVIVPVYKVEPYLRRCVDSILNQTFREFELILVDDGSPDSCGDICEAYGQQDSRIHVIHQKNGGLSAARNTGIDWAFANSDSRWLAFVDSDDWVTPDYLEQLYRAVSETGCQMSACGFYRTEGVQLPQHKAYEVQTMSPEEYYCSGDVHHGVTAVAWNKLYRKTLFEQIRYPYGKLHEDEFTTYQMLFTLERIAVIPAELYAYFQNSAGIMLSKWNPKRMHLLEAARQQIEFAQQNGYSGLKEKAVMLYIFGSYEQLKMVNSLPEQRPYRSVLKKELRHALKLGRTSGVFPLCCEKLWAYEEAYPCKPFWWLLSKVR